MFSFTFRNCMYKIVLHIWVYCITSECPLQSKEGVRFLRNGVMDGCLGNTTYLQEQVLLAHEPSLQAPNLMLNHPVLISSPLPQFSDFMFFFCFCIFTKLFNTMKYMLLTLSQLKGFIYFNFFCFVVQTQTLS